MTTDYNEFNQIKFEKKYIISKKENKQNFEILSSSKEIRSNKFELVDENFLTSRNIDKSLYSDKYVFNFTINRKNYIQFPKEYIMLEIPIETNLAVDNKVECEVPKENGKNRIKNLIQLYKEEMDIFALFEKNINNEKDMKEYYLINKNWIDIYKEKNNYEKIKEIILKDKKNLNEEEFLRVNYDKISNEIKDLPENLLKEENFKPKCNLNFLAIDESKNLFCPQEFVLVSDKLFDSLYKEIKNSNKNNYHKYKTIIGDNVLFIQDKKHDNIFYAFTKDKNSNIQLCPYLFKYNDKNIFLDDIKNYIQNKGFDNYLIERKIQFHSSPKLDILYNQDNKEIGKYINYKTMNEDTYKKMKIKNSLIRSQNSYIKYKLINDKILKFNKNNNNLSTVINEINNKQNPNNYVDVIVILNDELIKLKKNLYFPQAEELLKLKDKKEEQKTKLENMVNELANDPSHNSDTKNYVKNIKLIKPNEITQNNKYNFVNKDFLIAINNSGDYINSLPEEYYFLGNNEKFIFYPKEQKIYKVEFDNSNNFFKLKEYEFNLGYKEIIEKLKDLNKIEAKIENLFKISLKNVTKSDTYYLVNKNWMKEFKTFYDYDNTIKNKGNNSFKSQKFPDKLNNNDYLNTELNKNLCNNTNVPINFEIFNKKNFDLIIKEINEKNKIQLKMKYEFNIYICDNKLFVQDNDNKFLYFIYSLNNKEYTLDYLIKLNQIKDIKEFISKCEINDKFENLIIRYGIKLSTQGDQNLIDDNFNSIGVLKNINLKQIGGKKDPNHCLGLENIGATCYMNATIQCLCHVPNVKNYFQDKQLVYNDTNNKNCRLTKEFNKLVNNLWKEPAGNKKCYKPTDFKDCISEMNPLFRGIAANDSKDLIIFLYETMHNEINKKDQKRSISIN